MYDRNSGGTLSVIAPGWPWRTKWKTDKVSSMTLDFSKLYPGLTMYNKLRGIMTCHKITEITYIYSRMHANTHISINMTRLAFSNVKTKPALLRLPSGQTDNFMSTISMGVLHANAVFLYLFCLAAQNVGL